MATAKNKKNQIGWQKGLGACLIAGPFIGLILILMSYAIASFTVSSLKEAPETSLPINVNVSAEIDSSVPANQEMADIRESVMTMVNVILGFLALLCVLGIFIGVPVGAILVSRNSSKRFDYKEAIKFGWEKMKANFLNFFLICMISAIISYLPQVFGELLFDPKRIVYSFFVGLILGIISWVINLFVYLGWDNITLKAADGQEFGVKDLFLPVKLVVSYFLGSLVYLAIIFAGCLLFIVPGIIWAIKYQFYPFQILQGKGPIEALKNSGRITQGAKADIFLFSLIIGSINMLGALCFLVGLFATIPASLVAMAFVYRKLEKNADKIQ